MRARAYSTSTGSGGGGGGASPGGDPQSIQINNGDGTFGGFGSWDGSLFTLPGSIQLSNSISFATGANIQDDGNGGLIFGGDGFSFDNPVTVASLIVQGTTSLDDDLSFPNFSNINGVYQIAFTDGTAQLSGGAGAMIVNSSFSDSANAWGLRTDGSASFADDVATIDSFGNANFNSVNTGSYQLEATTLVESLSMNVFTFLPNASNVFVMDGNTGILTAPFFQGDGSGLSNIPNPSITMTSNTTATATFNSAGNDETIYDTSGTLITALTIALPSTTRVGQILRYLSNRTVTTTTVTGTVLVGASPVISANTSIAYQAVDTSGSFIRIQ